MKPCHLKVSKRAHEQAMHLCRVYSNVEWNSTILFTIEYDEEIGEYYFIREVIPHTIGTAASADFNYKDVQPLVLKRMMELVKDNPDIFDYHQGVMHSHNNMRAYFSSDDNDELLTNTKFHNFYLSVVVNNSGNYYAKVGFNIDKIDFMIREGVSTYTKSLFKTNEVVYVGVSVAENIYVEEMFIDDEFKYLVDNMKQTSYRFHQPQLPFNKRIQNNEDLRELLSSDYLDDEEYFKDENDDEDAFGDKYPKDNDTFLDGYDHTLWDKW